MKKQASSVQYSSYYLASLLSADRSVSHSGTEVTVLKTWYNF